MKERNGFVTNSSSSSFIIGKKEDVTVTIDSVYQIMRTLYKEMLETRNNFINYLKNNSDYDMEYVQGEYWEDFRFKEKRPFEYKHKRRKEVEKEFGVDTWESYRPDDYYKWIDLETYEEYEKFWLKKLKEGKTAPFTITDYLEVKPVKWLHWKNDSEEIEYTRIGLDSDELGWYYPYIEDIIESGYNCEKCKCNEWCGKIDNGHCQETQKMLKNKTFTEEMACLFLLGRVCVHSESGYINDSIVKKLREISEYSCNHMG